MMPGSAPVLGGVGPPTITFNQLLSDSSTASSWTISNISLGAEAGDRLVLIGVASGGADSLVSVTIGGQAMSLVVSGSSGTSGANSIYSRLVPTGATATVVVTATGSVGGGIGCFSYSAYNLKSTTPFDTGAGATNTASVSANCNTTSGGCVLAVGAAIEGITLLVNSSTMTGVTKDASSKTNRQFNSGGHLNGTSTVTPLSITLSSPNAVSSMCVSASFA